MPNLKYQIQNPHAYIFGMTICTNRQKIIILNIDKFVWIKHYLR